MKLRECPFCGSGSLMRERYIKGVSNRKHYRRECQHCKATFATWFKSAEKANEAWNRRADHPVDATAMVEPENRPLHEPSTNEEKEFIEKAIRVFKFYARLPYEGNEEFKKMHELAAIALQEKQEREKGCEWCRGDEGPVMLLELKKDGYIHAEFCPMCGKRLEVEP